MDGVAADGRRIGHFLADSFGWVRGAGRWVGFCPVIRFALPLGGRMISVNAEVRLALCVCR